MFRRPDFPLNSDFSAISATSHFAAKPLGFLSAPIFQRFPKARESVKYLVEDGRFDVIETGSLISIKENVENIVIPSEEVKIRMRPLTFEEFLHAAGKDVLLGYIRECWNKRVALDRAYHEQASALLREYMLVGGMPQSVVAYFENGKSFFTRPTGRSAESSRYMKTTSKKPLGATALAYRPCSKASRAFCRGTRKRSR